MKYISNIIKDGYKSFETWRTYSNIRERALRLRKRLIKRKGYSSIDNKVLKHIIEYAKSEFGSESYWPWLAYYTEIREEFIEGWIPEEYYKEELLPQLNPRTIAGLSTIKSFDYRLFKGFAIEPMLLKISNKFYDKDLNLINIHGALGLLKSTETEMVFKIDGAPSGRGHAFINPGDLNISFLQSFSDCVIQPVVKQHDRLNELYSKSINTLRIVTVLGHDGVVDDKYVMLRIGRGGSRVDNMCAGGLCFNVDNNGKVISTAFDNDGMDAGKRHPDTGFEYDKMVVPAVSEAVQKCKEYHLQFPYTKLIAWDVYIDQNREPGLIEWNAIAPDSWFQEAIIGPLNLDKYL